MGCWDMLKDPGDRVAIRRFGPLTLHVRRLRDEWHVAATRGVDVEEEGGPQAASEAGLQWRRWVVVDGSGGLTLAPVMPERPIVVRPEFPIAIPPSQHAVFYVSIPVSVRVAAMPGEVLLQEVPSVVLSKIWFGEPTAGEMCYSVVSRARRVLEDSAAQEHRAVCPVAIRNASPRTVTLERLCVHVEHLAVYGGRGQLWTPRVDVVFQGDDQEVQLSYGSEPPAECAEAALLTPARVPMRGGFLRRKLGGIPFLS